jgi:hypothetical protein
MPTVLESVSYIFCFHGLMCGPFCFYKDYIAFIEGENYKSSEQVLVTDSTNQVRLLLLVLLLKGTVYILKDQSLADCKSGVLIAICTVLVCHCCGVTGSVMLLVRFSPSSGHQQACVPLQAAIFNGIARV